MARGDKRGRPRKSQATSKVAKSPAYEVPSRGQSVSLEEDGEAPQEACHPSSPKAVEPSSLLSLRKKLPLLAADLQSLQPTQPSVQNSPNPDLGASSPEGHRSGLSRQAPERTKRISTPNPAAPLTDLPQPNGFIPDLQYQPNSTKADSPLPSSEQYTSFNASISSKISDPVCSSLTGYPGHKFESHRSCSS